METGRADRVKASRYSIVYTDLVLLRYRPGPIARSSMQTLAVYGLRLGLQLALLFLIARYLGPAQFGEFAGIAALAVGLGTLSSFGLGFLVLGESAKSPDRGQVLLAQAVPATLLSAVVLVPLYVWLCRMLLGSEASMPVLVLIGFSDLLLVPWLALVSHRIHGLGQVARSQAIVVLPMGLRLAGLVACVALAPGAGLELYAIVHVGGALAAILLSLSLSGKNVAGFLHPHWPELGTLRQGAGFAVMNFMAINPGELDKALALRLLGAGDAGLYALASRGLTLVTLPVAAMFQAALPRLIRDLPESGGESRYLLLLVLSLSALYGLVAATALHFAGPPLLDWLFRSSYPGIGAVVAKVALIAPFMSVRIATGTTLFVFGRPLLRSGIEGGALVLLISLALILTPRFGINGLVFAVLISEAAMALLGGVALATHLRRAGLSPVSMFRSGLG